MHFIRIFSAFLLIVFAAPTEARNSHRALSSSIHYKHKRSLLAHQNRTAHPGDDPAELQKRDGTKYVFMHHIVGNTYPYTQGDWADDIQQIQAKGVDALALNIGGDAWQRNQIASAYAAAAALGTGFKLFISFDLTEMGCDVNDLIGRVNQFANHPSQFKVNGKPMISSYAGDCLGPGGWAYLKGQTNGYLMPFIWGLEGQFNNWPALDSWYCWGCAWPQGNFEKTSADDNYYINQLGNKYATTISGWIYTHFSYKNWLLRSDNWLINSRWEQLVAMRDQLTFVEMVTWNDYGESDYFGPFKGAQPSGTTWATGFPHTAWFDMSQYYITAFKTGSYPAITKDVIYFWARPHPAAATASADSLGRPSNSDWTQDFLWAAVFATSTSTVTLKCGSSSQTFNNVQPGVTKLKIPLAAGKITVTMVKNGQTVINTTPDDYTFVLNPQTYNYNAYVGSATANGSPPTTPTTPTTSTAPTTTPIATPTNSPATPSGSGNWNYVGCFPDTTSSRTLGGGISNSDAGQTVSKCQATCSAGGYVYSGVEYGKECYCSNAILAGVTAKADNECNMACAGKADDKCGGGNRVSIYTTKSIPPTSPSATFSYYGCVAEGTTGSRRALTGASFSRSDMTPQVCQSLCSGYQYFGVEYGSECYCGNTLTNNGATGALIDNSRCSSNCAGDASKKCGGGWILSVYSKSASNTQWKSAGCYIDGDNRMLRGSITSQAGMTTDKCTGICSSQGYKIAATEHGKQCYCGSQIIKTGTIGTPTAANQCNMPCDGNASQICGAGWRASVYTAPGTTL